MVTADNHTGAAVILTEGGMKQALSGTGIAHVKGVPALDHVFFYKIVLYEAVDTFYTNFGRNIAGF